MIQDAVFEPSAGRGHRQERGLIIYFKLEDKREPEPA